MGIYIGDNNNNTFRGGSGDDILQGGAGDDSLQGETGEDFLQGGDGNDLVAILQNIGITDAENILANNTDFVEFRWKLGFFALNPTSWLE